MEGYEYFEVVDVLRERKEEVEKVFKMLEYFITGEEREKIFCLLSNLDKNIDDYTDRCLTHDTCPKCGAPLQEYKWSDDCGNHMVRYCGDCDYKEED